jgi:hypothetical protein
MDLKSQKFREIGSRALGASRPSDSGTLILRMLRGDGGAIEEPEQIGQSASGARTFEDRMVSLGRRSAAPNAGWVSTSRNPSRFEVGRNF